MGLLQNVETLKKLQNYLSNTNFGNQAIGHNLTLGFLPKPLQKKLEDKRYTMGLRHRLLSNTAFSKVTYSEIIVGTIIALTEDITDLPEATLKLYTDVGLIEDKKCTKELISTVVANSIAMNASIHLGNTTTKLKYSDNLMNILPEFQERNITYFLNNLEKYKPKK